MKGTANRVKEPTERYTIERRYCGTRTAEDVVTALLRAHR